MLFKRILKQVEVVRVGVQALPVISLFRVTPRNVGKHLISWKARCGHGFKKVRPEQGWGGPPLSPMVFPLIPFEGASPSTPDGQKLSRATQEAGSLFLT